MKTNMRFDNLSNGNTKDKTRYPEGFPPDIEELILADGAGENFLTFYRVSRTGLVNRDAFISTYEETTNRDMQTHSADNGIDTIDIGEYSTSGYEKRCEKQVEAYETL